MRRILYMLAAAAAMCSCVKAPEMIDVREIGCAMPDLEVTADAGECSFDILSSGECEVSFDEQVINFNESQNVGTPRVLSH